MGEAGSRSGMEGNGFMATDLRPPMTLREVALPSSLVLDITLRRAMFDGETSTLQLAESLATNTSLMDAIVEELRRLRYLEVSGLEGRNYLLRLTELGYQHALERMQLCRYGGALPVSLDDYTAQVQAQAARPKIDRSSLREAFCDLVVSDELLDRLGPAIRSKGAMFLYGPPGTGKSAIAERLARVFDDDIVVPHAVEVEGQVITVLDPVIHQRVTPQPEDLDRRWVLCHRPSVIAGGELTIAQLDLTHDPMSGTYLAPLQMQANNGVLVIDDLGRQQVTAEQLLNRWLVPLDRSRDYLTLSFGVEFEIPCIQKIVFCTNLSPAHIADAAFFRRLRGKIRVGSVTDDEFDEILRRAAETHAVSVTVDAPALLRRASRQQDDGELRPYVPDAICDLVAAISEYGDSRAVLDDEMVERATSLYFTEERSMAAFGSNGSRTVPVA